MKTQISIADLKSFIEKNDEEFKSYLFQLTKISVVRTIRHFHASKLDSFFNKEHKKSFTIQDDELYALYSKGDYSKKINMIGDSYYFWLNEAYNWYVKIKEIKNGDSIILDEVEKVSFDYLMIFVNNFSLRNKEIEIKKNSIGFHNESDKKD